MNFYVDLSEFSAEVRMILIDDIQTTINNRVSTMRKIVESNKV